MRQTSPRGTVAGMTEPTYLLPDIGAPSADASPTRWRASDADREHVARIIRVAAGEGLLTLAEAEDRLTLVYAARFRVELDPLTVDLPDAEAMLANTPEARRAAAAGLRRHALTVAVLAAVLVMVWALADSPFFWPVWPLVFMAVSVVRHARRIGPRR